MQDRKLTSGQTIGRYRIVSLIAEGGMGRVYLVEDLKIDPAFDEIRSDPKFQE